MRRLASESGWNNELNKFDAGNSIKALQSVPFMVAPKLPSPSRTFTDYAQEAGVPFTVASNGVKLQFCLHAVLGNLRFCRAFPMSIFAECKTIKLTKKLINDGESFEFKLEMDGKVTATMVKNTNETKWADLDTKWKDLQIFSMKSFDEVHHEDGLHFENVDGKNVFPDLELCESEFLHAPYWSSWSESECSKTCG